MSVRVVKFTIGLDIVGINVAFVVVAVVAVGRYIGNSLGLPLTNNSASDLGLLWAFSSFL